ncbi:hypothetical protein CDG81_14560 [Actinopolyspora erythraea]|uniref:Uncharacterized protein n=1 Tax=Actinopolyspora erythraea TaxID=414996 RepID=A0A099D3R7_9ACTN|nr:hypothetical protein [Actinopolyspora erythraea]ASU79310.1 hypothetical protein CDG81_14560 [Actinopolyspora erythraea]KGI80704.1 hypothetical protein IL38_15210 [Actinopolyspora erythraea]
MDEAAGGDEQDDITPSGACGSGAGKDQDTGDTDYGEMLRRHSAGWRLLAERMHPDQRPELDRLDELGMGSTPLRDLLDGFRQQALLLHSIVSAQARAYEEMIEAGGPDDPEAYENYRRTIESLHELLPGDRH